MKNKVAVTSRSFSTHPELRSALMQHYPQATFNETGKTLDGDALIHFLKGHDSAIVGLERFNADIFAHLPQLKVISRFGVGLDTLDIPAMKSLGIKLAYTAGANKRAVAELVIAFAIAMLRNLPQLHQEIKNGQWQPRKGRQLTGATVGIMGMGAIGQDLACLLKSFDCEILCFDLISHDLFCEQHHIRQTDLETLLRESEIVSLHLPLTTETKYLLNSQRLSLMQPKAILINAARGGLVDEAAVKAMLKNQTLAAAAFDVFATEPPADQELLSLSNFYATPHIGGSTEEAILAMGKAAIDGLKKAVIPN